MCRKERTGGFLGLPLAQSGHCFWCPATQYSCVSATKATAPFTLPRRRLSDRELVATIQISSFCLLLSLPVLGWPQLGVWITSTPFFFKNFHLLSPRIKHYRILELQIETDHLHSNLDFPVRQRRTQTQRWICSSWKVYKKARAFRAEFMSPRPKHADKNYPVVDVRGNTTNNHVGAINSHFATLTIFFF